MNNSSLTTLFTNPFGLNQVNLFSAPSVVDIDHDGDLDIFLGEENGDVSFFENIGSLEKPEFLPAVVNPFSIENVAIVVGDGEIAESLIAEGKIPQYDFNPAFGDLDGDGDLDILVGTYPYGIHLYYENIGNASTPVYATPEFNPFGLPSIDDFSAPALVDIDNDGDLDLIEGDYPYGRTYYFENIGTSNDPSFAAAVINPFEISVSGTVSSPELEDIDADGDLDMFIGVDTGDTLYFENIGDAESPKFAEAVKNPFGLENVGIYGSNEFADLDGDGDLDALIGIKDGRTFYFENIADSAEKRPQFIRYKTTVSSSSEAIQFIGDEANDYIIGSAGNDQIETGSGRNQVRAGDGNDRVYGGLYADVLDGEAGHDRLYGNQGDDVLRGGKGRDFLKGGQGADRLFGGDGDDYLSGGGGKDYLDGGAGDDTVDYSYWHGGGIYNLAEGTAGAPGTYVETIINFEHIKTGNGRDSITGTSDQNVIQAGGGQDTLIGGGGDDRLTGGRAGDRFRFISLEDGIDIITDFSWKEGDKIEIDASQFGAVSQHQFSYNTYTGELSFNASLTDGISPQTFAILENRPSGFHVSLDMAFV